MPTNARLKLGGLGKLASVNLEMGASRSRSYESTYRPPTDPSRANQTQ